MEHKTFRDAVEACKDIRGAYQTGLKALGKQSVVVQATNKRELSGSVDIDKATLPLYPHAARWDYVVGYKERAYFVEIHPANTSNVAEMVRKVEWLKDWLDEKGEPLKKIKVKPYYWVPSGKVAILPKSKQARLLGTNNIKLIKVLELK